MQEQSNRVDFSIIVPVFNVEKYIVRCIESVVKQTFQNFELIIVDDESPDNSIYLAEEYMRLEAFDKYKIISQKNRGLGGARNTGILNATGDYLIFLDSDDYIDLHLLEKLKNILESESYDIVMYNSILVDEVGEIISYNNMTNSLSGRFCAKENEKLLTVYPAAWNKIFKRTFFLEKELFFPEKMLYEDFPITYPLIAAANSVWICEDYLYYYVQRQGSIMNSKVSNRMLDIIKASELLISNFELLELRNFFSREIEYLIVNSCLLITIPYINYYEKKNIMQKKIVEYIQGTFPKCYDNSYFTDNQKSDIKLLMNMDFILYYKVRTRKEKMKKYVKKILPNRICKIIQSINRKRRQGE